MVYLIAGLVLFLGLHTLRFAAEDWRERTRARIGVGAYKGIYSLLSAIGLALVVWGFALARETPLVLWNPPAGMRHATAALTLLAFVLLAAAYVPGNALKARLHHPMVQGVKAWALGHLLVNGTLAHVLLFGSFLLWALASHISARRRDVRDGVQYPAGNLPATLLTVVLGVAVWWVFAFVLHGVLIGVRPFG